MNKFRVGDKVKHVEHGNKVWTVEIVQAKQVYWIGTKTEFISMVPESQLKSVKRTNRSE